MENELTTNQSVTYKPLALDGAVEQALIVGDLSRLTIPQRLEYYKAVCKSLGLNPLTKPFDYIVLNGKMVLYPNGDCADQLRAIHRVSIYKLEKRTEDGIYEVTAYAELPDGRRDQATGFVYVDNLKGADRANAKMKTETKAKRRVTLSIVGLSGFSGIELSDETASAFRYDDPNADDVISVREREVKSIPSPRGEWAEELDGCLQEISGVPGTHEISANDIAAAVATQDAPPNQPTQPMTRELYFAIAAEKGLQKEAARIANSHTQGKTTDWAQAGLELQEQIRAF